MPQSSSKIILLRDLEVLARSKIYLGITNNFRI
jgi:hypothetical protein